MTRRRAWFHAANVAGCLAYAVLVGIDLDNLWKVAAWPLATLLVDALAEHRRNLAAARLEAHRARLEGDELEDDTGRG